MPDIIHTPSLPIVSSCFSCFHVLVVIEPCCKAIHLHKLQFFCWIHRQNTGGKPRECQKMMNHTGGAANLPEISQVHFMGRKPNCRVWSQTSDQIAAYLVECWLNSPLVWQGCFIEGHDPHHIRHNISLSFRGVGTSRNLD